MLAGLWAAVELAIGLLVGEFAARARAEPVAFLMVRPPLLVVLAWVASAAPWRERLLLYLAALAAALSGDVLLQLLLAGPPDPATLLRAVLLAGVTLVVSDVAIQLVRRHGGRYGPAIAALVLLLPVSLAPVREAGTAFVLSGWAGTREDPAEAPPPARRLAILTGLPIIWGEGDMADVLAGRSAPADIHMILQRAYAVEPLDRVDGAALSTHALLLIAQPRALDPEELVAVDGWVRAGGRALILADPLLAWPSRWPLGDPRRAPPVTLLDPLFRHWGLDLVADEAAGRQAVRMLAGRRLETEGAGRFTVLPRACRAEGGGLIADCPIGKGRALLVADADLLDSRQWKGPGARGGTVDQRRADNPGLVLDWLARLDGGPGAAGRRVAWIDPARPIGLPVAIAFLPALLLLAGGVLASGPTAGWKRFRRDGRRAGESPISGVDPEEGNGG